MASDKSVLPSREPIDQLREAVFTPMAVRAALQLGIFTPLANGPMTTQELADTLGVKPRRLEMLLYQLVTAEILELHDDRFANTAMTTHYFVEGSPDYIGGIHGLWTELFTAQLQTAESIRTDTPIAKIDFAEMSQEELGGFLRGLHGGAVAAGRILAKDAVFAEAKNVMDVGGGSGGLPIALCQEHPHLNATLYELPSVAPIAAEMISEATLEDRITADTHDVLAKPIVGNFDVAVARSLFQVLSTEQCRKAARNIAAAMPSGGTIFVIGLVCDDTRLSPVKCVNINLFFLNVFDDGEAYTESQYRGWLHDAGFVNVTREPFMAGASVIRGRKK
jgi:hypothetical protein